MTHQPRHLGAGTGDSAPDQEPVATEQLPVATEQLPVATEREPVTTEQEPVATEPVEAPTEVAAKPKPDRRKARGDARHRDDDPTRSAAGHAGRFVREIVIIVVIALVASALLRAFVVQAFFVPSGSMLPEIQLNDRILVTRIGDIDRGEVVVFEDPGGWIGSGESAPPPGAIRSGFEFIGVLPASGHEHLVKRVIGLPGDHVVCCNHDGLLTINDYPVDESDFIFQKEKRADNVSFDVIVPEDSIFVLGDHRYVSGDSSRHLESGDAFIPMDLVTGRAFAVVWPKSNAHMLRIPDAYDDVPEGGDAPSEGVINSVEDGS